MIYKHTKLVQKSCDGIQKTIVSEVVNMRREKIKGEIMDRKSRYIIWFNWEVCTICNEDYSRLSYQAVT